MIAPLGDTEARPCDQASEIDSWSILPMSPVVVVAMVFMVPVTFMECPAIGVVIIVSDGSSKLRHTGACARRRASTHTFRRTSSSIRRPTRTLDRA